MLVKVAHRECKTWSDYFALSALRVVRWGFDLVSGYRHESARILSEKDPAEAARKYGMTERKYMIRNIFLESVAGTLRPLRVIGVGTTADVVLFC